jgi:DNA polymerase III subunit beta
MDPTTERDTDRAFRCSRAELYRALTIVEPAVAATSFEPCLRGVLIRAGDGYLTLTGSNRETFISLRIPGSGRGAALIDHSDLLAKVTARSYAETSTLPVTINGDADGWKLAIGKRRGVALTHYSLEDFPRETPPVPWLVTTDRAPFVDARAHVATAIGRDPRDECAGFRGVKVELTSRAVTLVATDRFRLAVAPLPTTESTALPPGGIRCLAPPAAFDVALEHTTGDHVRLAYGTIDRRTLLSFACDDITVATHVRPATDFPAHSELIPKSAPATVTLDREELLMMARRAQLIGASLSPRIWALSLTVADGAVSVVPVTTGPAVSGRSIPALVTGLSQRLRVSIRARNLIEALQAFASDHVVLHVTDPDEPAAPIVLTAAMDGLSAHGAVQHVLAPAKLDDDATSARMPVASSVRVRCRAAALVDAIDATRMMLDEDDLSTGRRVRVEATSGGATLTGDTDDAVISVDLPAQAESIDETALLLDGVQLQGLLAAIAYGDPRATSLDATIKAERDGIAWLELAGYVVPLTRCGPAYRWWVPDTPELTLEVEGPAFRSIVRAALTVVDLSERDLPMVRSVRFEAGFETVAVTATDRFQVVGGRVSATALGTGPDGTHVWVDGAALEQIVKRVGSSPVRLGWDDESEDVAIAFGRVTVLVRASLKTNGVGPERFLEQTCIACATITRKDLVAAVSAAAAELDGKGDKWVAVTPVAGGIAVAPRCAPDDSPAEPRIVAADLVGPTGGDPVYLQPRYAINGLDLFSDEDQVTLHFTGENHPVIITAGDSPATGGIPFRYGVMPWVKPTR